MKNKKWIIVAVLLAIAVLAVVLILTKDKPTSEGPKAIDIEDIEVEASAEGISVVSVDNIAGMFVEDGSDEVLSDIFTVTFRNDSDKALQYAKLVLTIGEENYNFELSTIPAGASVRAMEKDRKPLVNTKGDVKLTQENIAWFEDEPSMHSDMVKISQTNNAVILENVSGQTINAPIYVYYKNFDDEVYIGGITYRAGTQETLEPGATAVLSAKHFDPEASQLMFVTYAP